MLKINMVNGETYTGRIIYSCILQSYAPLMHCNDEFIVLQDSSGKQWQLNRGLIVSIYDTTQT
jgi:hypothetical protein